DNDGLPNQWEMDNFGNMNQDPNGDEDNDGLTNLQEYTFGTDPNLSRSDHDNDSLPDTWEAQYGKLSNLNGRNEDKDSDGISNWIEYKLGTDPTAANDKAIGIFYEYDKLGRIKKIERTPSQ
ncbi:MAG: hypothetical protein GY874_04015, partial [Desulfobacteraceae bacterium]|nr:hypothetical protein [Desulfobacteraceae bacterium]